MKICDRGQGAWPTTAPEEKLRLSDDDPRHEDVLPRVAKEQAYRQIATVLDSLDVLIYVSDMKSHEILFINRYGKRTWGQSEGLACWKVFQEGQGGPCAFCNNHQLLDAQEKPTGVHVWEVQNPTTGNWYLCRNQAIRWIDGRWVRLEIATDITERKKMELDLEAAKLRAESLARTDDLTGLYNRRAFFDLARGCFKQACRFGRELSVLVIDVDHFKRINDGYGHPAGDRMLREIANCLHDNLREVDVVGRIGGEELAVLLPETGLEDAVALAERLRRAIGEIRIIDQGRPICCTASLGVACRQAGVETLETLISHADSALYAAKRGGRNRVKIDRRP